MPVPSIESIADRDQVTAQALAAAAEHIAADGGLLDPMGLWAVDPASLVQLGVLAGDPYRIDADDLRASVDASVAERGSDMGDRMVEPVALPAGGGFRATYLNALDLAQHVEYHLRTPTGRYLVLAASLPGLFDESLSAMVDEVAGRWPPSRARRATESPAPLASSAPAADLLASLPEQVGAVELERRLLGGELLVTSSGEASGSLASSLGVLVDAPADLTLAIGTPSDSDQDLVVAAFALADIDQAALDQVLCTFPEEVWSRTRVGSVGALVSVRGEGGRHTWLWSGALPMATRCSTRWTRPMGRWHARSSTPSARWCSSSSWCRCTPPTSGRRTPEATSPGGRHHAGECRGAEEWPRPGRSGSRPGHAILTGSPRRVGARTRRPTARGWWR